jgi:hypothetical protein
MARNATLQAVENVFRQAMTCRKCFTDGLAQSAFINVAQPRWVGPNYFSARPRVLILTLNPGAGNTPEKKESNVPFRQVLYDYRDGTRSLHELFAFQLQYISQWGTPSGRFVRFYMDGMSLRLNDVSLANVAWCADASNKWAGGMLSQCFRMHTGKLVAALRPDAIILSGSGTHRFRSGIERLVPSCKVIPTIHYAHRKGQAAEKTELNRVRKEIASARK